MSWENPSNEQIKTLLEESETIAVIGLSDNPNRTSYQIAEAMQKSGYKIIPINPKIDEVLGEKSFNSLKDVNQSIDIINVFRRSEYLPDIAKEASEIKSKGFWAQQGVIHEEVPKILEENGTLVIMDLCIKVAHAVMLKK